jgi:integrase
MSRLSGRLTALAVKHATKRGLYPDGNGLCLQVARNGSRSWIMRYRMGGRRRYCGLGSVAEVTLADARERAAAARLMLQNGQDPIEVKQGRRVAAMLTTAKAMTFAACSKAYVESHRAGWAPRNTKQWVASLTSHVYPIIGALPVQEVDTALVLRCVEPLWSVKTETASRLRGRIEAIIDWAKTSGYREGENPARWDGHLANLLPAKAKVTKVEHHAALPYAALPVFMGELRQRPGLPARALEFAILTAVRTGEVLNADWSEIDLQGRVWTIPGVRMKAGKEHRVALSDAAVALLGALPGSHTGLVFPGFKAGRPLAKMALANILKRMGHGDVTVHGFRSSFADWAHERTAFPSEVIEMALAHSVGNKVQAAYVRTDLLDRRVMVMEQFADFCAGKVQPSATVTELRRA